MDIGAVLGNGTAAQPAAQAFRRQCQIQRQQTSVALIDPKNLDFRLTGVRGGGEFEKRLIELFENCLLYTSDAADE